VFLKPSTTDVVCTTTAEARAFDARLPLQGGTKMRR